MMTLNATRGRFARVCVEIDLDQPVVGKVWFQNNWFKIQYEGLHLLFGVMWRTCLFQEETLWYQKSREQWIKLGSRNTSFFHAQAVVHRKCSKVHGLFLASGEWCTDASLLNYDDQVLLGAPVSKEDVFQALMEMKSYKAPGPDGFQPIFYKMYWDVVGDDVWSFVRTAFAIGFFDPQAAETLIVLIPKHECPRHLKDFQPISLCNVLHKLISKVLVNRLRPILNRIGDLILKLDLEKADDRVDWSFLRRILIDLGFPPHIISLIMHGVSSASLCLLWNGQKAGTITPRRGLRQGSWSPYRLRGGPVVSHLFFADDVLLFSKATTSSMRIIMKVIDLFCDASGMRVRYLGRKYLPYGSPNLEPLEKPFWEF
uniref:Retrovirus-related Pol polyprotein LINE-1 n=1 Tax=Cajanus cajan TaxID=3821 RepID=A0A151RQ43_CAJCA|nr:Retrovirus-related Pol polyprotein LINE-1 [Cajanus cajan]